MGWIVAAAIVAAWAVSANRDPPTAGLQETSRSAPPPVADSRPEPIHPPAQVSPDPVYRPSQPTPSVSPLAGAQQQQNPTVTVPLVQTVMYARSRVRVRSGPSIDAQVVLTTEPGASVLVTAREGEWLKVSVGGRTGWIRRDLLTGKPPPADSPSALVTKRVQPKPSDRSGEPIRDPYVGTCDCPYDRMRNGRACGGRSAYSRPGGRSPVCYF
jgi:uncharacterized protein YgiM (DUF1202 family)